MQLDPIKPMLKAPGSMLLKLIYDELLSSFAFHFNLRCYTMAFCPPVVGMKRAVGRGLHPRPLFCSI